MNFLLFCLYFLICSFLLFIIILLVYRFIVKRKCNLVERTAIKTIDDYFKAYDNDFPVDFQKAVHEVNDVNNTNR